MLIGILLLALAFTGPLPLCAAEPLTGLPVLEEMAPLVPLGEVEVHTPETLWEKIDGEAELYRRFGFVRSASVSFGLGDPADRRVEITVFDLGSHLGAFGVFASFRSPGDREEAIGNGAVMGDHLGFFWHGPLFVLADAAGPDATRAGDLRRAVAAAAAELGPAPPRPAALEAFLGTVDHSTARFLPDHLLGREALPPGFEGETPGGLAVFSASARTEETALAEYGKVLVDQSRSAWDGAVVLAGTDQVLGPVTVALRAGRLAGARARPDAAGVREAVERLLKAAAALLP